MSNDKHILGIFHRYGEWKVTLDEVGKTIFGDWKRITAKRRICTVCYKQQRKVTFKWAMPPDEEENHDIL